MEELKHLAKIYYQNTISLRYFDWESCTLLVVVFALLVSGGYLQLSMNLDYLSTIPLITAGVLGSEARKRYDRNLVRYLSSQTLLDSDSLDCHKAAYLQLLVSHISGSLFDAMKSLKEVRETSQSEHALSAKSEWARFFNFVYNSESKNRILSLVIYLISLIAFITIPRTDGALNLYEFVNQITFNTVVNYLMIVVLFIVLFYAILVLPIAFAYKFLVVPLLLKTSSVDMLSRFFISELAKYAYTEERVQRNS